MESIASTQDKWMNEWKDEWTNKWIGKNEWNVWASKGWELGGEEGRGGGMNGREWMNGYSLRKNGGMNGRFLYSTLISIIYQGIKLKLQDISTI